MFPRAFLPLFCLLTLTWTLRADPGPATPTVAEQSYQRGQLAMDQDRFHDAIDQFQVSLRLDPSLHQAHLSMAACYLALGQDIKAVPHMQSYLEAKPDHFLVRMPFAEVLLKVEEFDQARAQLNRFIADVQNYPRLADDHLIACHTRLMELAIRLGDDYAEKLNRGIGLYLLAVKRMELGGKPSFRAAEELLCKAAAELTLARVARPEEARPSFYLHGVWSRLGQRQPADRSLREAEERAGLTYLTPWERRYLHLASDLRILDHRKK